MKNICAIIFLTATLFGCDYPVSYESPCGTAVPEESLGLEIVPATVSILENEHAKLSVVILRSDGTRVPAEQSRLTFLCGEKNVAISADGTVSGLSPGTGEITVIADSFIKSVPFKVRGRPHYERLVISEVMYSPATNERELEYIEIFNTGNSPCILDGVSVTNSGASSKPFLLDGLTIAPAGFILLGRSGDSFAVFYGHRADAFPFTFDLANSGDAVFLLDPAGKEIDAAYIKDGGKSQPPSIWGAEISVKKGKSMSRIDPYKKTGTSSDFAESDPTPGFL